MKRYPQLGKALTTRSLIIGAFGSAILTASSLYIALKMGALPWPIVFAVLASVVALRLFKSTDLHEANVTHAAMSAGAMIAGGLAFTIPALWISDPSASISLTEVLLVAFVGTILGLVACALFQPYFIGKKNLTYPIGVSAADTLKATANNKGADAKGLFCGMGVAALWAYVRDGLGYLPQVLFATNSFPGIAAGIMNSPMMWALGFMVGPLMAGVWFLGALIGNVGIAWGLPTFGFTDAQTADAIRTSLGLGMMLGVGAGVVVLNIVESIFKALKSKKTVSSDSSFDASRSLGISYPFVAGISVLVATLAAFIFNMGIGAGTLLVASTWFCVWLAAWLTGTTGVNPMEIFGVITLLLIQYVFSITDMKMLFIAAGIVAVACGICGDVMCDMKAGDILRTNPRAQFSGMIVGGLVGALVSSLLLIGLFWVFGPEAFGPHSYFVSAQASVVAVMAGGIPHIGAFLVGVGTGIILAVLKLPVMTLGLGIYLPFFISAGAGLGALIRVVFDVWAKKSQKNDAYQGAAQAIASGVLGGESLVGVITALIALASLIHM